MKTSKLLPVMSVCLLFIMLTCCKNNKTSYFEKVADGYVIVVPEEVVKNLNGDKKKFSITFVSKNEKEIDSTNIRQILSDKSIYSTLTGDVSKIATNKLKIRTTSNLSIDLNKPYIGYFGLSSEGVSHIVNGEVIPCGCACHGACYNVCAGENPTNPNSYCCGGC